MTFADQNPSKRRYCYPQCRDPFFNECADCWQSDGNPAIGAKGDEPKPPLTEQNPSSMRQTKPRQKPGPSTRKDKVIES